jgi:hypothetical protein
MTQNLLQVLVGIGLVGYAVVLLAQRAKTLRLPWGKTAERAPVDDLRLVIDLAARLRDAGKTDAVAVCQKLLDELLKPGVPTP